MGFFVAQAGLCGRGSWVDPALLFQVDQGHALILFRFKERKEQWQDKQSKDGAGDEAANNDDGEGAGGFGAKAILESG